MNSIRSFIFWLCILAPVAAYSNTAVTSSIPDLSKSIYSRSFVPAPAPHPVSTDNAAKPAATPPPHMGRMCKIPAHLHSKFLIFSLLLPCFMSPVQIRVRIKIRQEQKQTQILALRCKLPRRKLNCRPSENRKSTMQQ